MANSADQRQTPRQRVIGTPQVDITHAAAGEQLVIVVHVDVPTDYAVPSGFKANIASAVQAVAFPSSISEEQES